MENNITDLFAEVSRCTAEEVNKEYAKEKKGKYSSLSTSALTETMNLMSNPEKLKGILMLFGLFLLIGVISVITFFVIYPICIVWAIGSYIVIAIGRKIIKSKKDVHSKRDR